jgi:hypothetical protein
MTKFECERNGVVVGFETFEECSDYVWKRSMVNELWGYIGQADELYQIETEKAAERFYAGDRDFTPPYEP